MRRPFRRSAGDASRRNFWRASEGAAAVEFGMLAFPLCMMIFIILELALIFILDSVLENAAIETGRLVRTGQASAQSMTREAFKTRLCQKMSVFEAECATRASIDVQVVEQFADPLTEPTVTAGVMDPATTCYEIGDPGDIVIVRVWYRQPFLTSFLNQGVAKIGDGVTVLMASTAFRNEPWVPSGAPAPPQGCPNAP